MLYFDTENGLLVRRTVLRRTSLGPLPTTMDFADYRDVSGVKMPFKVTVSTPDVVQNLQVTEMKANIPVEDSRFAMPKEGETGGGQ
jgi:zinc protease